MKSGITYFWRCMQLTPVGSGAEWRSPSEDARSWTSRPWRVDPLWTGPYPVVWWWSPGWTKDWVQWRHFKRLCGLNHENLQNNVRPPLPTTQGPHGWLFINVIATATIQHLSTHTSLILNVSSLYLAGIRKRIRKQQQLITGCSVKRNV